MKKLIIEVGSTCTKLDEVNDSEIKRIKDVTIEFKRNFSKKMIKVISRNK